MRYITVLAALLVFSGLVRGDEIIFNNGDRLTGTIKTNADGRIIIDSPGAGEVVVDLRKAQSIRTDAPSNVTLSDGTTTSGTIAPMGDGLVTVNQRNYKLTDLKTINAPPVRWTGSFTLNGMFTRGNSSTESVGLDADIVRRSEKDRISAGAEYIYSRYKDPDTGDRVVSADAWEILGKYDYYFTSDFYTFFQIVLERDNVADLELRITPSIGVGYEWIDKPDFHFNTEAGVTWVYEDYEGARPDNHMSIRLAYHMDKSINDKVKLFHNLEFLPNVEDFQDFNVSADAGVRTTITKNFYSEFKVDWEYDATPAPDARKNDVRVLLGIGYTF